MTTNRIARALLASVGVAHLLPATAVLSRDRLERAYGVTVPDADTELLLRHRATFFGLLGTALLAGAASGLACGINDRILWYPGADVPFTAVYITSTTISGAVIAGLGGWLLMKALASTGALSRFASGREATARV